MRVDATWFVPCLCSACRIAARLRVCAEARPPHLILRGELPLGVFTDLIKLGAVVEERIIGSDASDPPQVVFFPPAYLVFNKSVRWLDPFIPPRKK
jgi:hypothetical protein